MFMAAEFIVVKASVCFFPFWWERREKCDGYQLREIDKIGVFYS